VRVAGIIPARYASSRFDGKALAVIEGKTLIRHVYERSRSSRCISELIVATDDPRIASEVESFGGTVAMTSPQHSCGSERVAEVAARIDADIVVNIQGDELMSSGEMIDECVSPLLKDSSLDVSTLAVRIDDRELLNDPNVVKVVRDLGGDALYFSRSPIPHAPLKAGAPDNVCFLRHVGIYAFRRKFLFLFVRLERTPLELAERLEQLRILEHGHRISVILTNNTCLGVDVPADVRRAAAFLKTVGQTSSKERAL